MNINSTIESLLFEHRFWLQILGDHSRFILLSLAPSETEHIITAQEFILLFDSLLKTAQQFLSEQELEELNKSSYEAASRVRDFKLELLTMALDSDRTSGLAPTFLNDMLNETEEYLNLMIAMHNRIPLLRHPLHYHMLWLSDAAGHAALVSASLDRCEQALIHQACRYELQFQDLYRKALHMNGYLRTQLKQFPALTRMNEQSAAAVTDFIEFLDTLRDQRMDQRILGTLHPLMADHMSRESCYYLWKLSAITKTMRRLDCDPTRPRLEL